MNAITFQRYNNFINPSRVSPLDVNTLYTSDDRKRAILQCNYNTAICLTPILSRDSCILEPSPQGLRNKYLSGHFHHQEWERFAGFACMVFDHKVMVAQIRDGVMSFGTMGYKGMYLAFSFLFLFANLLGWYSWPWFCISEEASEESWDLIGTIWI